MTHIYCGDGKGKTTAACGLALRAAGSGMKVLFVQFFKDGSSSEITMLQQAGIRTMASEKTFRWVTQLSKEEQERARADCLQFFNGVLKEAPAYQMLVLDEVISACSSRAADEEALLAFIEAHPEMEIVLTGRGPSEGMLAAGDYITEMKKVRHPFDQGVYARKGIEY